MICKFTRGLLLLPVSVLAFAIAANASDASKDYSQAHHGFYRNAQGGITSFNPPGSQFTYASAINSQTQIAGDYEDASGMRHGFLLTP